VPDGRDLGLRIRVSPLPIQLFGEARELPAGTSQLAPIHRATPSDARGVRAGGVLVGEARGPGGEEAGGRGGGEVGDVEGRDV
jgi:hypothetical protein